MLSGMWRASMAPVDRRAVANSLQCLESALATLMDDHGGTFAWEIFAGAARLTLLTVHGGHVAGAPVDIRASIDLRDASTRAHFVVLVQKFKPWLITMAWPCTVWSILNRWNFGMGRVQDLPERQDRDEADFLEFVEQIGAIQKQGKRLLVGENLHTSSAFD